MTKLQIISRQWSSIYDLLLYIQDKEKAKSLEDIQQDLDIIEYSCRKYVDVDDEETNMDNEPISRAEHEEFRKRIEAEDNRQNRRIEILENSVQQLQELVTSVQTLRKRRNIRIAFAGNSCCKRIQRKKQQSS